VSDRRTQIDIVLKMKHNSGVLGLQQFTTICQTKNIQLRRWWNPCYSRLHRYVAL